MKTTEIRLPFAAEFSAPEGGKSKGFCVVEVPPEHAEQFEKLRRRGAVSVELVVTFAPGAREGER